MMSLVLSVLPAPDSPEMTMHWSTFVFRMAPTAVGERGYEGGVGMRREEASVAGSHGAIDSTYTLRRQWQRCVATARQ